jgi:hypothetical protein
LRQTWVLLGTLLLTSPAWAGEGEYRQIVEQMAAYAERNAWPAVERLFVELEGVKDAPITAADLYLGAQAGRTIGNAKACRTRLMAAFDMALMSGQSFDAEASQWLGELQTDYGHVLLIAKGEGQLTAVEPPFQPDRQAAIEYARVDLEADGRFDGLLPAGTYTYGSATFEVAAGPDRVKLKVKSK